MYYIAIYFLGGGRCQEPVETLKKAEERVKEISLYGISYDCPIGEYIHRPPQQITSIHVYDEDDIP